MDIEQKFPSVRDMRQAAQKRIPKFAWDYLSEGIGQNHSLQNNRTALDKVLLSPKYLVDDADTPDCSQSLLGQTYSHPFGVAPVGLGGLVWPGIAEALASAAKRQNLPFCLSSFATVRMETIFDLAAENAWYQHYMCADDDDNKTLLQRALNCGYKNLVITIDIPTVTRRNHNIKNGLSVPPGMNARNLMQICQNPQWALSTLKHGIPRFENFTELLPQNTTLEQTGFYLQHMIEGHVTLDRLKAIRDKWPHKLIVKGILSENDAIQCVELGADSLVLSNHGGRQLDAANSVIPRIKPIRNVVGSELPIIVDGGATTGLDVMRYIACGADFVLMGRAFMYAVAAMGPQGANHVMQVLSEEMENTMAQIGCASVENLPNFLFTT